REEMDRPGPARAAVARAVRHTAPAIATAGVVLAASFGSLAVNAVPSTQQIGFATALGIMLSAFVLSIVLVPALAALLGRSTWWPIRPGRGDRGAQHAAPYAGASYAGQPHADQPYADQQYPGQSYAGQPYPGQPHASEPYPGQPRAHPPYYDDLNAR
ncbi:MMPL family transporter, partial [Streptomyces sp. AC627_RSS907]